MQRRKRDSSPDVLKKMLPLAATLMMGALSKRSVEAVRRHSAARRWVARAADIMAMLTPLLDQNRDGSIVDDVTSMIGRAIKRP